MSVWRRIKVHLYCRTRVWSWTYPPALANFYLGLRALSMNCWYPSYRGVELSSSASYALELEAHAIVEVLSSAHRSSIESGADPDPFGSPV